MHLSYIGIDLSIDFDEPVRFRTFPTFIFRSLLGKELRKLTCLFRGRNCAECPLRFTCAYGSIFESHIRKNNEILEGRDRASHPFILYCDAPVDQPVKNTSLNITLIGKAVEYLPYIYYSLEKAGKIGIFRNRVPFSIDNARVNGTSLIESDDHSLNMNFERSVWQTTGEHSSMPGGVGIRFLSPVRMKIGGAYTTDITPEALLRTIVRRIHILVSLYEEDVGNNQDLDISDLRIPEGYKARFTWQDLHYFSFRQRRSLKMGGALGNMDIHEPVSNEVMDILRFGEIFHVGKNVSFGLGKIKIEGLERGMNT